MDAETMLKKIQEVFPDPCDLMKLIGIGIVMVFMFVMIIVEAIG